MTPTKVKRVPIALATSALAVILAAAAAGCDLYFGNGVPRGDVHCGDSSSIDADAEAPPLDLGAPVSQREDPPPPISGGTLAIAPDNVLAVAADPDRDQIYVVDLERGSLASIALRRGDEPGRVFIGDSGTAYVALRSGGAIARIDTLTGTLVARHPVCPAPRGLTLDPRTGLLWVACHGGALIRLRPDTGEIVARTRLQPGLRDVVVGRGIDQHIFVSVFRTAELYVLDREARIVERMRPPVLTEPLRDPDGDEFIGRFEPGVAWRILPRSGSGVEMLHQRARKGRVSIIPGGYGGRSCTGGVVHGAVTPLIPGVTPLATAATADAVLPVDFALIDDGASALIVASGNAGFERDPIETILPMSTGRAHEMFSCDSAPPQNYFAAGSQPIAIASRANDAFVVQSREPAQLMLYEVDEVYPVRIIPLSSRSREDSGHTLFHTAGGARVACASCHPEGADDGKVWEFECVGSRRTQSLQFGLLGTEPFHWNGDMTDLHELMSEVFVGRMSGPRPQPAHIDALGSWLDTLRVPPRASPEDPMRTARGAAIFADAAVGCARCHSGAKFTDNASYDVGTGGVFQVPSLIGVADRAPFMHTGCAASLRNRFTDARCGGGDRHGVTSSLTPDQIDDLVGFLETL